MKLSIITATYNRPTQLVSIALPSIKSQTDRNFEWIVINDGANPDTRDIITSVRETIENPIIYIEMEHPLPTSGFGLCYGRNLGIDVASGEIVSYLDDDNSVVPEFVASTRQHFEQHPNIRYSMARQNRCRNIVKNGHVIRQGQPFISPRNCCSLQELLWQKEIFDSNGFAHFKNNAPRWNPQFQVFADYEYLLQCIDVWGEGSFSPNNSILVNYVQSSSGIIGSSSYEQWASELSLILTNQIKYPVVEESIVERLRELVDTYTTKGRNYSTPKAFVLDS